MNASAAETAGADGARISFSARDRSVEIRYRVAREIPSESPRTIFVAVATGEEGGSAVLPFGEGAEGSTVFLPFRAETFYAFEVAATASRTWKREWRKWKWQDREDDPKEAQLGIEDGMAVIRLQWGESKSAKLAVYSKDFSAEKWGRIFGASDPAVRPGTGDKYIPHFLELRPGKDGVAPVRRGRFGSISRPRIYQLFVRLFSNTNERRKPNGTMAENGSGKFEQINDAALTALQQMGFTHIWLTGVLQQATGTEYGEIGQPADDPDLLKGIAGSPYAIKDYFDVSPDYAVDPAKRLEEFKALVDRIHGRKMKVLIDFVPNHVARSYGSDIRPEYDFGNADVTGSFFEPQNNFFYLGANAAGSAPLRLPTVVDGRAVSPTCRVEGMNCDGIFPPETSIGRVTGNNVVSWSPSINDWYETVKLNYGFDFTDRSRREYPSAASPDKPIPDTWKKMDAVLAYWQELGVDGFRCDMAHMVPPEFWDWVIAKARARDEDVFFVAEAYDNDPAKVGGMHPVISKLNEGRSNVMFDLLNAGFDAVYDDPTYKTLKRIYEGPAWANDIDGAVPDPFIFDNSLRYAENHDEVRLAAPGQWGGVGAKIGPAISAILFGIGRGPAMIYNGQEVAEPGAGAEGFGGDDARTSIFDYWSMPELVRWVNGHAYDGGKLSPDQQTLRADYARLLAVIGEPAFRDGSFFPLNGVNGGNPQYGRIDSESASGHWLYSFLRYDPASSQRFLVVVNLHPERPLNDVRIVLPPEATGFFDFPATGVTLRLRDKLAGAGATEVEAKTAEASDAGIPVGDVPPHTARFFELQLEDDARNSN